MLGETVTDPNSLQLSLIQKKEAEQQQDLHLRPKSSIEYDQIKLQQAVNEPLGLKQWRSTRET